MNATQFKLYKERVHDQCRRSGPSGNVFPRRLTVPPTTSALPLWPKQIEWLKGQECRLRKTDEGWCLLLSGSAKKWYNRDAIKRALFGRLFIKDKKDVRVYFG